MIAELRRGKDYIILNILLTRNFIELIDFLKLGGSGGMLQKNFEFFLQSLRLFLVVMGNYSINCEIVIIWLHIVTIFLLPIIENCSNRVYSWRYKYK